MASQGPQRTSGNRTTSSVQSCQSLRQAVGQLSSSKSSTIYSALVAIRTRFIKEKDGYRRLCQYGGVEQLLSLLRNYKQQNKKTLDVLLSILGNCAMVTKAQQKMTDSEAPSLIGAVILADVDSSIHNRAVRTLANLSQLPAASCHLHQVSGLVSAVVKMLRDTEDDECQQTYARAIRLWSNTRRHMLLMLQVEALDALFHLLTSSSSPVLTCALKAITHFLHIYQSDSHIAVHCDKNHASDLQEGDNPTPGCDTTALNLISAVMAQRVEPITVERLEDEVSRSLARCEGLKSLITLTSHSLPSLSTAVHNLLLRSVSNPLLRPLFGNAGGIPFLVDSLQNTRKLRYANALCLCCQEAVNRVRVREAGLCLLLELLDDGDFKQIHNRIVSALVCFVYDEVSLDALLKKGLCVTLAKHLHGNPTSAASTKPDEQSKSADDNFADDDNDDTITEAAVVAEELNKAGDATNTDNHGLNQGPTSSTAQRTHRDSPTYSIHSPTYQELSQTSSAAGYDSDGPTNLWDYGSQGSGTWGPIGSPTKSSASYSPLSTSSYNSPPWSNLSPPTSPASSYDGSIRVPTPPFFAGSPLSTLTSSPGISLTPPTPSSIPLSPLSASSPAQDDIALPELADSPWLDSLYTGDILDSEGMFVDGASSAPVSNTSPVQVAEQGGETTPLKRCHSFTEGVDNKRRRTGRSPAPSQPGLNIDEDLDGNMGSRQEDISIDPHVHRDPHRLTQHNILVLLSRVSHLDDPSPYLINSPVIESLLNYITKTRRPLTRATRILERITSHRHCFPDLIRLMTPVNIHQFLTETVSGQDYVELRDNLLANLALLTESCYGRGSVTQLLTSVSRERRINTALSLPFICRNTNHLRCMLKDLGGLDLILQCLDPGDSLISAAISGLVHLAKSKPDSLPTPPSHPTSTLPQPPVISPDITLQMDTGEFVGACRQVLTSRSEVFRVMLGGDYVESTQQTIKIPGVSHDAFKALMFLIHLPGNSDVAKLPLDTTLEILALTDRFMLLDIQVHISSVLHSTLTVNDIPHVIDLSLTHNNMWLAKRCLVRLLTDDITHARRLSLFGELFECHSMTDIVDAVRCLCVHMIS